MFRSTLCAVALIGLLATAGCLGFLGAGTEPTPTTTPPPTPTPTGPTSPAETVSGTASRTPDGTGPPPAVGTDGFASAERIANAHDAALRNTSFTIRHREVRIRNGTVVHREVGTLRHDGDGAVYYNYTTVDNESATASHVRRWRNGTTGRRKITTRNGTVVESVGPILGAPTFANGIEIYLQSFRTRVTGYSRLGGEPTVRVSATELARSGSADASPIRVLAFRLGFRDISGGRFSADVADGVVRRYRVRLVGRTGNELERRIIHVAFTKVGTTTVPRPAWATATNASRGG